ncbi:MAG: ABC transporter permease subunit [Escherichia sp.]
MTKDLVSLVVKEAAIYSGINVTRLKIKVFMITAVLAGISGMILPHAYSATESC